MPTEWLTAAESRILLGVDERVVRLVAQNERWRSSDVTCRGGRRKLFNRLDVLAYKARRDGTALPPLVTAGPTPTAIAVRPEGSFEHAPTAARERVEGRVAVILAWEQWQAAQRSSIDAFLLEWNRLHPAVKPVKRGALYRWLADYKAGGVDELVPGWYLRAAKGKRGPRIPEDLEKYFDTLYLHQNRPTVLRCWKTTEERARDLGLSMPSYMTFKRHVDALPKPTVTLGRYGMKVYLDKCSPYTDRDYSTVAANGYWNSDHHQLDIICIGLDGKPMRPWITVWEDVRSQVCLGYALVESPNSTSIWLSFMRAAMRYGLPSNILLDNGKDYRSYDIAGGRPKTVRFEVNPAQGQCLVGRLGIEIHWANPYNARSKPAERMFREFKEHFSQTFESYCGGTTLEKPERLAALVKRRDGMPTILDVEAALGDYIEAIYNRNPCSREGMPRIDAWRALLKEKRTTSPRNLYLMAMRSKKPVLVRRGKIVVFGHGFDCSEWPDLEGREVVPHYDPMNIAQVHLYRPDGTPIGLVGAKGSIPWGATEDDYREEARIKKGHRQATKADLAARIDADLNPQGVLRSVVETRLRLLAAAGKAPESVPPEPPVIRPPEWPTSLPAEARAVANGGYELPSGIDDEREHRADQGMGMMDLVLERAKRAQRDSRTTPLHDGGTA